MGGRGASSGNGGMKGPVYDYSDRSQSNSVLTPDGETWWNSLDSKEQKLVETYTGSYYSTFNEEVRKAGGDPDKMSPTIKRRYERAVKMLGEGNLDRNMVFHRQSTSSLLGIGSGASFEQIQATVGKVVEDHSITSVRSSRYNNGGSGMFGNVNYHITTPAGKGIGAYVANHSSCGKGEDEFLMRPGSAYRIDKVWRDTNGNPHIAMTYMGNSHDKGGVKKSTGSKKTGTKASKVPDFNKMNNEQFYKYMTTGKTK